MSKPKDTFWQRLTPRYLQRFSELLLRCCGGYDEALSQQNVCVYSYIHTHFNLKGVTADPNTSYVKGQIPRFMSLETVGQWTSAGLGIQRKHNRGFGEMLFCFKMINDVISDNTCQRGPYSVEFSLSFLIEEEEDTACTVECFYCV